MTPPSNRCEAGSADASINQPLECGTARGLAALGRSCSDRAAMRPMRSTTRRLGDALLNGQCRTKQAAPLLRHRDPPIGVGQSLTCLSQTNQVRLIPSVVR